MTQLVTHAVRAGDMPPEAHRAPGWPTSSELTSQDSEILYASIDRSSEQEWFQEAWKGVHAMLKSCTFHMTQQESHQGTGTFTLSSVHNWSLQRRQPRANSMRAVSTSSGVQGMSIKQPFKQTSAQADRRTGSQTYRQTARRRSSPLKWRTASSQP
ncbi:MAG: hypothetical protein FRX49_08950 [Trebouxia sp. A1-2]|nr:MAG: hypothetical protein FRX49_08950 [Trebouxia sp. A1-2]